MRMYKEYKICQIGEVIGGGTPSTSNEAYWNGNIPWITPKDLTEYSSVYISYGEDNISEAGLNKSGTRLLPKNTVLFSSRAPIGYVAIAQNPICTNQGFKSIICDEAIIDPLYFYYYIKANLDYFKLWGSGATFPEISGNVMKRIKIRIIDDINQQKKIASLLYSYDKLIEINNKRIKVLEQMAENLYKEWFVRFRFPGHESAKFSSSRIGKIPSSFSIIKMQDAFDYYIGGGWGNDDKDKDNSVAAYVIRGTDFPRVSKGDLSTCPLRYHKKSNYSARQLFPDDIILEVSGGTAEQPVGRVLLVTKDTIDRLGGKVICASFCKQIRIKKDIISPIYYYYWMKYLYDTRIIDRFQLQSTGIINFQFEYFLKKGDILLPTREIMNEFDLKIRTIHNEISAIAKQNENLIKQRDLLLPRLMSGKLEIK